MDNDTFVQKVKMLCLEKGLKPTNVCNECGVGGSFLPDIKRGRSPSVDKVQMLAAYLGVTTSELLGEEKESAPVTEGGVTDSLRSTLLRNFDRLNQEGQERLVETSDDMVSSGKYIKSDSTGLGQEKA